MTRQHRTSNFSALFLVLVIFLCMSWVWQMDRQPEPDYSELCQLFEQEKVESFQFTDSNTVVLNLRGQEETVQCQVYSFELFYDDLNDLIQQQKAKGVITSYDYPPPESTDWLELLLPWILMAVVG